jgi:hypothetical protein
MPVTKELNRSGTLVIAATGFSHKLNLPVKAFFREAGLCYASKFVMTDPDRRLTLGGLPPQHPSFFDLLEHLRRETTRAPAERLVVTGTSAGGHTALLLGHLLDADYTVAFAPYPYLSMAEAEKTGDPTVKRMHEKEHPTTDLPDEVRPFFDLRDILSDWNGQTRYHVHVPRYNEWDFARSRYLRDVPRVSVHLHPYKNHSLAHYLARDGKLRSCFSFPYSKTVNVHDLRLHWARLKERYLSSN